MRYIKEINTLRKNELFLRDVYNVLIELGEASKDEQNTFIFAHKENDCDEYRFQGKFGFGGKYLIQYNSITAESFIKDSELDIVNDALKVVISKYLCKHCNNILCDSQKFNNQCFECGKQCQ